MQIGNWLHNALKVNVINATLYLFSHIIKIWSIVKMEPIFKETKASSVEKIHDIYHQLAILQ